MGTRAGYSLQSFFAAADKKRISVSIPGASMQVVLACLYSSIIDVAKHNNLPLIMEESKAYWKKWYVAVITILLLQIAAYYFITQHFK